MCCSSISRRHNLMRLVGMVCPNYIDRNCSLVSIFWHYWTPVGISLKRKKKYLNSDWRSMGCPWKTIQPYMEVPWYDSLGFYLSRSSHMTSGVCTCIPGCLDAECWLQIISFVEPPWKIFQAYAIEAFIFGSGGFWVDVNN